MKPVPRTDDIVCERIQYTGIVTIPGKRYHLSKNLNVKMVVPLVFAVCSGEVHYSPYRFRVTHIKALASENAEIFADQITCNWASVCEPHTCDFSVAISLHKKIIYICDRLF